MGQTVFLKSFAHLATRGFLNWMPDKAYINLMFQYHMDSKINWKKPETFNEKLQWLKLYNRNPEYVQMVDKIEVKKYVSNLIGEEYVVPTLGTWEYFDDIDFSRLPEQFVLKCSHDSGGTIICRDKSNFDRIAAKKKLEKNLKRNFYLYGREWPYKGVKPLILAEPYLEDTTTKELRDYKFFCFHGQVKFFKVDYNRFICHHANYYDLDRRLLPFGELICPPDPSTKIVLPDNLDEMFSLAAKLCQKIPFIRVDLYSVCGKIYFSELTFFPASGFGQFVPNEWDEKLGAFIQIPDKGGNS